MLNQFYYRLETAIVFDMSTQMHDRVETTHTVSAFYARLDHLIGRYGCFKFNGFIVIMVFIYIFIKLFEWVVHDCFMALFHVISQSGGRIQH